MCAVLNGHTHAQPDWTYVGSKVNAVTGSRRTETYNTTLSGTTKLRDGSVYLDPAVVPFKRWRQERRSAMPAYSIFGWQKPCYLQQDGYAETFSELVDTTDWSKYGRASGNPRCQDCMVHCGFEPSAVNATFTSARAMGATIASMVTKQL